MPISTTSPLAANAGPGNQADASCRLSRRTLLVSTAAVAAVPWPALAAVAPQAVKTDWDLSAIFADDAAWERERQAVLAELPQLSTFRGNLSAPAPTLRAALSAASGLKQRILRLDTYAALKGDADLRDAVAQQRRQLSQALFTAFFEKSSWMDDEIAALGRPAVDRILKADPQLARFRVGIDEAFRRAPHRLSPEGEMLLAAAEKPLSASGVIQAQLAAGDIPRPELTVSSGKVVHLDYAAFSSVSRSPIRADRDAAYRAYWGSWKQFEGSLGATLSGSLDADVFRARARRHASSLDAALFEQNIPVEVYRILIAETNAALPILHRYYDLRRKMLKLTDLRYEDVTAPVSAFHRRFDVTEMRALTLAAVAPLGSAYVERLAGATTNGWMDALPRPGKYGGGYTNPGAYGVHPFLIMNLTPTYTGLTTFAHEWGHAMHGALAMAAQPFDTFNAPTFVQEVASTCNEQLLARYMIARASTPHEKLFYLAQQMEQFANTLFRQVMRAEFEAKVHGIIERGEGMSGERLSAIYLELMRRYHGPGVTIDPVYGIEWARVIQFYNAFYVFQYATAITGAAHCADAVTRGGAAGRDRYLSMLMAGGSKPGYETLRGGGVDLATAAPYRLVMNMFSGTLDQAEDLLARASDN